MSPSELERYRRHLSLAEIGAAGQEKLKSARVLVIGAGGLGSPSSLYLAASGVGTLGIVDCDRIDVTNLQRQVLFDTASIDRPKAEAARERLQALNPEIRIVAHAVELRANNIRDVLRDYDVVLDGTDRMATRFLVNDACVLLKKPLVSAAIHRFEGQAMTYVPGRGPCYRCLFPEPPAPGTIPSCAEAGVLGVLPGVLGTIQATEAIKLIAGIGEPLIGRLLTYDALEMRFQEFAFARRSDCAVCGDRPTVTELKDSVELCSPEALNRVRRLAPRELQALITAGDSGKFAIIDVREPGEFAVSRLPNARSIPLGELSRRIGELARDRRPVFICRSGGRSKQACAIALGAGIADPTDLAGGLLAWAAEVDSTFIVAPLE
ncbi:MAG TPA: molybdopterin-synthase adenylyltransferase MoeB [Steroidobacteraceae bacterium]|nr:molybdopterin-synthase adenylyltransferase MoeB [Steroidobacteraceae bacterium]